MVVTALRGSTVQDPRWGPLARHTALAGSAGAGLWSETAAVAGLPES